VTLTSWPLLYLAVSGSAQFISRRFSVTSLIEPFVAYLANRGSFVPVGQDKRIKNLEPGWTAPLWRACESLDCPSFLHL
jgi:hypothetical protein